MITNKDIIMIKIYLSCNLNKNLKYTVCHQLMLVICVCTGTESGSASGRLESLGKFLKTLQFLDILP